MGLFSRKSDDDVIDLTQAYKRKKLELEKKKALESPVSVSPKVETYDSPQSGFGFLSNLTSSQDSSESSYGEITDIDEGSSEDKRKRLAKRLIDMTDRIEELSNQIYHLQQRLEVLERKSHQ
ncbi:hypothetical protein COU57_00815 [Candidatus Pacearchaeota archaeon CG10_big_fil_rev_8_21_14_0_10_32_14]|nr:MAG: hypothetical protein COU57_00815 [Candidatus Pacearchaeota archaeon CG10_big_fil_rev_8_21_14_0_10_32_14]